jgi:putative ABC transport system permease protein
VAFAPSLSMVSGEAPVTIEGAGPSLKVGSAADPEPVSDGYFQVLGIPRLQGRQFSDLDRAESMPVAIVNQAFVARFFPKRDALGQRIKLGDPATKGPWLTIVGVVGNVSHPTLNVAYSQPPSVYRPLRQNPVGDLSVFIRTAGKTRAVESAVASAIAAVDSNLPLPALQTVNDSLSWFTGEPEFRAQLFAVFAGLGLLLAAVGIYGVLSQLVVQRTHEFGIRVALGARREDVLRLILGAGLKLIAVGIAIGIAGALVLTRLLAGMLYDVRATDPFTFVSVSLLLAGVALLACYIPARRATRMDPMVALRWE